MTEPAIVVDGLSKKFRLYHDRNQTLKAAVMRRRRARYEEFWALREVSLEIAEGATYGFIGTNGSGKSTLLKCLARILVPDEGASRTRGKVSALLELGAGFHPELSGRENVYLNGSILGLSKSELDRRFDDIVGFAGLERFIDTPVKNYSSGMYVRLGFSVAINVDPDILLVDEVLAVGDEQFQRRCNERFADLKAQGTTIVIVSHALGSIRTMCDEVAWLDNSRLRAVGAAGDLVDQYLSEVHEDRSTEVHATGARWGSGEVLLDRIELIDADGGATDDIRTGEHVTFRLHYVATQPIERPTFTLALHSVEGVLVTSPSAREAGVTPERLHGAGVVDLVVDRLPLLPGTYDLSGTISDESSLHVYDSRHRAVRFDVEPGRPRESFGGLVSLQGQWHHHADGLGAAAEQLMIALPGKLLVVVLPGDGDAATTTASFGSHQIDNLTVRCVEARRPSGLEAANVAARAAVDYLAFVPAGIAWPEEHLRRCIGHLRGDLSTGLVGGSPSGGRDGDLELFIPLAGAVVRHSAFHAVEGFDPAFGVLTDIDFGWRLWLRGFRARSAGPLPDGVTAAPPATDLDASTRHLLARVLDETSLGGEEWTAPEGALARRAAAGRRLVIQRTRARGDGELLPLAHAAVERWAATDPRAAPIAAVLREVGAPERAGARRRIAVVTSDTLAPRMAGPGIRALQIARRLAIDHEVVLATTERCELEEPSFRAVHVGERGLRDLERWCDVFLFQGWVLAGRDHLVHTDKVVIADVYDPMHLEQLEQGHDAAGERGRFEAVQSASAVLNEQLERADFMLCASAKQRDLWLGQLAGLGRVNPIVYDGDESLSSLLAVVPFGVGDAPPVATRHAIRGSVPGIGPDDHLVLWGGGVYNWFDPLTLIHAVDRLRARLPTVRLFFLGLRHPNPGIPEMRMAVEAQRLAAELGLDGTYVFFNHDWVAFEDRQNYLLDADIGVSTHLDHIETEFSFRTRILDYLWAGLPIVATGGDSFADVIVREELGLVVPPRDVEALELALERLLTDPELAATCRRNIAREIPLMRWAPVLEPLARFCAAPRRAPDAACPDIGPPREAEPLKRGWRRDADVAIQYVRAGAARLLLQRALDRVRRLVSRT